MEPLLKAEHLTICYDGTEIVKDVSFSLQKGEVLGIVGESGSGKSTLIRTIMGLPEEGRQVTCGSLRYQGQDLLQMSQKELRRFRGTEIGMIFQDSKAAFCPVRKIGRQMQETMQSHRKMRAKEVKELALAVMEKLGLEDPERIWNSYPFELSGGMNQRVGICMAMMQQPNLLLADEPTSALDVTVQRQVIEELQLMKQETEMAMILVTHNIDVVKQLADQILVLQDGQSKEYGDCQKVLEDPQDRYTRELIASVLTLRK